MDDQRIEAGPAFGLINPGNGGTIAGIRAKAINRLSREGHQGSFRQQSCCGLDAVWLWQKGLCLKDHAISVTRRFGCGCSSERFMLVHLRCLYQGDVTVAKPRNPITGDFA